MGFFYESMSSRGQNKMAAVGHLDFLSFDIIALRISCNTPFFNNLITYSIGMIIFTI